MRADVWFVVVLFGAAIVLAVIYAWMGGPDE